MSFDVFLQCYGETEHSGLSRSAVRSLFPILENESELNSWVIQYDALNSSLIYVDIHPSDDAYIDGLTIDRPCGDVRLWEAMLSILCMGSAVMFWPGSPPIFANVGTRERLPADIVESLGPPVGVTSASEIMSILKDT